MKLLKKTSMALGGIATIASPIVVTVACGSKEDMTKIVTIQAEKGWVNTYQSIINNFKKDNKKLMDDNGIKDIRIIEQGSFDVQEAVTNKGIKDEEAVADTFLVASDRISWYQNKRALKAFKENDAAAFLDKYIKGETFVSAANLNAGKPQNELIAVPHNVEAMIGYYKKPAANQPTPNTLKVVTKFSDLWMSAGYFNEAKGGFNLKDIVATDKKTGHVVLNKWFDAKTKKPVSQGTAGAKNISTYLEAGFDKILQQINALKAIQTKLDPELFNKDSGKAEPKVRDLFKNNPDNVQLLDGPWNFAKLDKEIGGVAANKAPTEWNQWGGGWYSVINARVTTPEQNVIEALIAEFYKDKYASELFTKLGKVSPVLKGKTILNDKTKKDYSTIPNAIYGSVVREKPTAAAFDNVWGAYASTISKYKEELAGIGGKTAPTKQALAKDFIKNIEAAIKTTNA